MQEIRGAAVVASRRAAAHQGYLRLSEMKQNDPEFLSE